MFLLVWYSNRGRAHQKYYNDLFKMFEDARKHKKFRVFRRKTTLNKNCFPQVCLATQGF